MEHTPTTLMLVIPVLGASIVGSLHCAGMCGGLALTLDGPSGPRASTQLGYHLGRLISYAALGAAFGLLGGLGDFAGAFVGIQRLATIVAGLVVAVGGVIVLMRAAGYAPPSIALPNWLTSKAQTIHLRALRYRGAWRGAVAGLGTVLLPCGWLWAFAAIAAGTASTAGGALVMAAFWAGTVPALAATTFGARVIANRLGRAAPVMIGVAMLLVGLNVAFSRSALAERVIQSAALSTPADAPATSESTKPSSPKQPAAAPLQLPSTTPSCCNK